ncbi:MAG: glycosyltransferase family 9 protein [Myxococcaceae bacterium]
MTPLKRLEIYGKYVLAVLAAALLWRPWRRARAQKRLTHPRSVLLVRIDNRVGEALLTTPLLRALKALPDAPRVELLVHPKAARVLRGHPDLDALRTFEPRARLLGPFSPAIRALRRERYDVVVNCASWADPSVGPAIVARLIGGRSAVLGPAIWPVRALFDVPVAPRTDTRHEARQRLHLLSPLRVDETQAPLSFRPVAEDEVVHTARNAAGGRPYAVINPGGRLGYRRVPAEVFSAAARALLESGVMPLITWGPGEEALAAESLRGAEGAVIAPPTDLDQLAALMSGACLTVCNNTGPMHLSVAVGTPTLGLFLHMETARWGHHDPPHRMVDLTGVEDQASEVAGEVRRMLDASRLDLRPKSP